MDQLSSLSSILSKTNGLQVTLKADTTFDELKMDEYDIVDFLMGVEEYYGIAFDNEKMLEVKNMQDVMNMIDSNNQEDL